MCRICFRGVVVKQSKERKKIKFIIELIMAEEKNIRLQKRVEGRQVATY